MAFLNRFQGVLLAFLLMVLLAGQVETLLTTQTVHQVDFWLIWLGCMVVLTLPILLLESALAKRTNALPLQALPALTRDADASTRWRSVGWLALGVVLLFAGALGSQISSHVFTLLKNNSELGSIHLIIPFVVIIGVVALSYIAKWLPLIGTLSVVVLAGLGMINPTVSSWQGTHFALTEWAGAVELAVVATGVGLGIYWQTILTQTGSTRQKILPIWIAQIVGGGVVALGGVDAINQGALLVIDALALLSGAAWLVAFARQQMIARGFPVVVIWVVLLASLAIWILPITLPLRFATMILAIVVPTIYAIFAGWKMKSSHLRKALDFNNEGLYNLWRVMVRLVIPLATVLALAGLVQQYLVWVH